MEEGHPLSPFRRGCGCSMDCTSSLPPDSKKRQLTESETVRQGSRWGADVQGEEGGALAEHSMGGVALACLLELYVGVRGVDEHGRLSGDRTHALTRAHLVRYARTCAVIKILCARIPLFPLPALLLLNLCLPMIFCAKVVTTDWVTALPWA